MFLCCLLYPPDNIQRHFLIDIDSWNSYISVTLAEQSWRNAVSLKLRSFHSHLLSPIQCLICCFRKSWSDLLLANSHSWRQMHLLYLLRWSFHRLSFILRKNQWISEYRFRHLVWSHWWSKAFWIDLGTGYRKLQALSCFGSCTLILNFAQFDGCRQDQASLHLRWPFDGFHITESFGMVRFRASPIGL